LFQPEKGRIVISGVTLLDTARGISLAVKDRRIGVVFQDLRLFPHMSVKDNILYGWHRTPEKPASERIDATIALLGLEPCLQSRPRTLSGGEKSRVALARALLMNPRVLLLDEPLAALDGTRKAEILPYLERLVQETKVPMLYVSHALDEVARLASRMVVLENGRVIAEGSLFDMTARLDLTSGAHLVPGTVLEAVVEVHDEAHGLTELSLMGDRLVVPAIAKAAGERVRIRIDAEDVMLALKRPEAISANNILEATIA